MMTTPERWKTIPTVLCHDWLTGMRGGEKCLEILCDGFPDAPIHTLLAKPEAVSEAIRRHPIHTSALQHLPGITQHYRNLLPLFPAAVRTLHPRDAALQISLNSCIAKSIRKPPGAKHICYCFTPMRYAWTFYDEYFGHNPLKGAALKPLLALLRAWDRRTSANVDQFVAISKHVQSRIKRFYGRDSVIVYPPVDVSRYTPSTDALAGVHGGFDLVLSALVPYKRIDLAVAAYNASGYPLKVVGIGGQLELLKRMAQPNVEILEWQSDAAIKSLYQSCRQLIFPGEEDFGIVPLEAQACGRPVVALRKGGALETIIEHETGVFFDEQTPASLNEAVARAAATQWDAEHIQRHAGTFGPQRYIDGLAAVIDSLQL